MGCVDVASAEDAGSGAPSVQQQSKGITETKTATGKKKFSYLRGLRGLVKFGLPDLTGFAPAMINLKFVASSETHFGNRDRLLWCKKQESGYIIVDRFGVRYEVPSKLKVKGRFYRLVVKERSLSEVVIDIKGRLNRSWRAGELIAIAQVMQAGEEKEAEKLAKIYFNNKRVKESGKAKAIKLAMAYLGAGQLITAANDYLRNDDLSVYKEKVNKLEERFGRVFRQQLKFNFDLLRERLEGMERYDAAGAEKIVVGLNNKMAKTALKTALIDGRAGGFVYYAVMNTGMPAEILRPMVMRRSNREADSEASDEKKSDKQKAVWHVDVDLLKELLPLWDNQMTVGLIGPPFGSPNLLKRGGFNFKGSMNGWLLMPLTVGDLAKVMAADILPAKGIGSVLNSAENLQEWLDDYAQLSRQDQILMYVNSGGAKQRGIALGALLQGGDKKSIELVVDQISSLRSWERVNALRSLTNGVDRNLVRPIFAALLKQAKEDGGAENEEYYARELKQMAKEMMVDHNLEEMMRKFGITQAEGDSNHQRRFNTIDMRHYNGLGGLHIWY
jgi:hypothetical protein